MKVAYITHFDIFGQLNYGGVIESRRHYDLLCSIYGEEAVVTIIAIPNPREDSDNVYYFMRKNDKVSVLWNCLNLRVELSSDIEKSIAKLVNAISVDIVVFESSFWWGVEKRLNPDIKTILCEQNIEKNYAWNRVLHKSVLTLPRFWAVSYNEKKMVRYSDSVVCLTSRDSIKLGNIYKRNADLILHISFKDRFDSNFDATKAISSELLFVGSNFPPNLEGLTWFVNEVMPKVDATLTVVGKDMEKAISVLTRDNVNIVGTVDDISPYYCGAKMVVMPIMWGDGMKVKTAEAMMYGKAILASSEALNGYDVDGCTSIYLCDSAEEYISRINELIRADNNYYEVTRQRFLDKYEHSAIISSFKKHLDTLVEEN